MSWIYCLLVFKIILIISEGITLKDGKYEDVNVIIQDTINENQQLIDRIKVIFTDASKLLFKATKHHVYFGQINIIVPSSWTKQDDYVTVPSLPDTSGYIRVDKGKLVTPHVKRRSYRCGGGGFYMFLHSDFILAESETAWGAHDRVIVHEWGHLRWGLFDEYGARGQFYQRNGRWEAPRCTSAMTGKIGIRTNCHQNLKVCDTSNTGKMMSRQCNFCPDIEGNVQASIMSHQFVNSLSMFCDEHEDGVPEWQRHNKDANNVHNIVCDRKSAWEIMRKHPDFKNVTNNRPADTDTTPNFVVMQESTDQSHRVFVLDKSGSMSNEGRIEALYEAGKYIIKEEIPSKSWLGIVWFNDSANVKKDLTQINAIKVRNELIAALPSVADGGTCIGCGINTAIQMLKDKLQSDSLKNSEIIVVSDGEDGNDVELVNAINSITATGVTVHTISISQDADQRMIDLADISGGKHLTFLDKGSTGLANIFSGAISKGMTTLGSEPLTLASERFTSKSTGLNFTFYTESGMENNITITIIKRDYGNLDVTIMGPNDFGLNASGLDRSLVITYPDALPIGKYDVTASSSVNTSWEYIVKAISTEPNPVRVSSRVVPSTIDLTNGELPVVLADVTKGFAPVTNADVIASVQFDEKACSFTLKDNGQDPDVLASDGTYSGYILPNCLGNRRVSVKVNVAAEAGKASVLDGIFGARSTLFDGYNAEPINETFERTNVVGDVFVSNYTTFNETTDDIAPGRITDVNIVDIETRMTNNGESRNFTIIWTATGDDMNIGNATEYELRYSTDQEFLVNNFSSAELLDIANNTLIPQPSGSIEAVRISIDAELSYTSTAYLAIVAKDDAGNVGRVSNPVPIVVAIGFNAKFEGRTDYNETDLEDYTEDLNDDIVKWKENHLGFIVSGTSAIVFAIGIVIVIVIVCHKRRPKSAGKDNSRRVNEGNSRERHRRTFNSPV